MSSCLSQEPPRPPARPGRDTSLPAGWRVLEWACRIPRAEGQFVAGPWGPLAPLPGSAAWDDGTLTLSHAAFRALEHLGQVNGHADGRITWDGEGIPVMHAGGECYEVTPVRDESPLRNR